MWKHLAGIALAARLAWSPAFADDLPEAWRICFTEAGRHYGISPAVLAAVARTESKLNPSAVHRNPDGTSDVGLMQINSRWFATLRQAGIPPSTLYQPCTSIWAGTWILAQAFARHGYTWESVGAYNAGERVSAASARRRAAYANRVLRNLAHGSLEQQLQDTARRSGIADFALAGAAGGDPNPAGQ